MTSVSFWNYYRDEISDDTNENDSACIKKNNNKTKTSKSFENKTKLIGSTSDNKNILDKEVVVPLKCLSQFWKSFDIPLINDEIELNAMVKSTFNISNISNIKNT